MCRGTVDTFDPKPFYHCFYYRYGGEDNDDNATDDDYKSLTTNYV